MTIGNVHILTAPPLRAANPDEIEMLLAGR
jgi:hypothetical protein